MTTKQSAYVLKSRTKHKEKYNAYQRNYNRRAAAHEKKRARAIIYDSVNYEKQLYTQVKGRAKRRGLEFNLEHSDIVIPEICYYLKVPLTRIRGQGIVYTNASIDRIDSKKGYIKGNIQIISYLANQIKTNATREQLETFARSVLEMNAHS